MRTLAAAAAAMLTVGALAQPEGEPRAPEWGVGDWRHLAEGVAALEVTDLRGRVVVLYLFAPRASAEGLAAFGALVDRFGAAPGVALVAIAADARRPSADALVAGVPENLGLEVPVGRAGAGGPALLGRYGAAAAPWFVILDFEGRIRWSGDRLDPEAASTLIRELRGGEGPRIGAEPLASDPGEAATLETLPAARGGQDIVGRRFPELKLDRWVRGAAKDPAGAEQPRATLYRWWTDACSFCERSLPAFDTLRLRYADRGLRVVAVYHPKPPRDVPDDEVLERASAIGYGGPIAADLDWSELDRVYDLASGRRRATSVSFLVDAEGVTRFCHPGPELHASEDPDHARCDADYRLLEDAILFLLRNY